ncbi:MAG: CZB domain-containing protein [Gammaproteobacteria bacterium]|nr:CZB domain-containing protein [Gammaproteobacteria bacterium]
MDLNRAIEIHADWKGKFRKAITEKQTLDAGMIAVDDRCELGCWLHGDAKARFSGFPSYQTCLTEHARFHAEAGKIAESINAGQYGEAEAMLAAGTPYAAASTSVGIAIMRLRKETTPG